MRNEPSSQKAGLISSVKTSLGFFVLLVLMAESVLLALVTNAEGTDRTLGIVGMILVLPANVVAVFFLAYRRPEALSFQVNKVVSQEFLVFEHVLSEIIPSIERLENKDNELAPYYQIQGDSQRLLDGLYSGLLYAAAAVPTGTVSPLFYGNLMELDGTRNGLRVRYFQGPYNDEIFCRIFPISGPRPGVATEAVASGQMQVRNL